MTLLPRFSLPDSKILEFLRLLNEVSKWTPIITVEGFEKDFFGEDKNIPVIILKKEKLLEELHFTLLDALASVNGSIQAENKFVKDLYSPHISYWSGGRENLTSMTLMHHRGGFGVDIFNVRNFIFNENIVV